MLVALTAGYAACGLAAAAFAYRRWPCDEPDSDDMLTTLAFLALWPVMVIAVAGYLVVRLLHRIAKP